MKRLIVASALCAFAMTLALAASAPVLAQDAFKIIINAKNETTEMSKEDVALCFLKKQVRWAGKGSVSPVDLPASSPVRAAFSKAILNKDVQAVKSLWNALIFSGKGVPPIEKANDAGVMAFVGSNESALGYVSASATLTADVKLLKVK